jgi:hypothetical protein
LGIALSYLQESVHGYNWYAFAAQGEMIHAEYELLEWYPELSKLVWRERQKISNGDMERIIELYNRACEEDDEEMQGELIELFRAQLTSIKIEQLILAVSIATGDWLFLQMSSHNTKGFGLPWEWIEQVPQLMIWYQALKAGKAHTKGVGVIDDPAEKLDGHTQMPKEADPELEYVHAMLNN